MAEKINKSLYNGKVSIDFYPNSHRYKKVGEKTYLISVTSVTGLVDKSRPLIKWALGLASDFLKNLLSKGVIIALANIEEAIDQHNIKREEAASIGDQVHDWVSEHIKAVLAGNSKPKLPDGKEVLNGVTAFLKWEEANKVKYNDEDKMVYSRKHDFVGKLDCNATVNGLLSMVDFKTGKGIYAEQYFQVAGYRNAYEEEYGCKFEQSLILHFGKDTGEFEVYICGDHEGDLRAFLGLLAAKKVLKVREKELKDIWKSKQPWANK